MFLTGRSGSDAHDCTRILRPSRFLEHINHRCRNIRIYYYVLWCTSARYDLCLVVFWHDLSNCIRLTLGKTRTVYKFRMIRKHRYYACIQDLDIKIVLKIWISGHQVLVIWSAKLLAAQNSDSSALLPQMGGGYDILQSVVKTYMNDRSQTKKQTAF